MSLCVCDLRRRIYTTFFFNNISFVLWSWPCNSVTQHQTFTENCVRENNVHLRFIRGAKVKVLFRWKYTRISFCLVAYACCVVRLTWKEVHEIGSESGVDTLPIDEPPALTRLRRDCCCHRISCNLTAIVCDTSNATQKCQPFALGCTHMTHTLLVSLLIAIPPLSHWI